MGNLAFGPGPKIPHNQKTNLNKLCKPHITNIFPGDTFEHRDNLNYLKTKENSDFIMSCYKKKGCDIFYPDSINIEGRNAALRLALAFDPGEKYLPLYFVIT